MGSRSSWLPCPCTLTRFTRIKHSMIMIRQDGNSQSVPSDSLVNRIRGYATAMKTVENPAIDSSAAPSAAPLNPHQRPRGIRTWHILASVPSLARLSFSPTLTPSSNKSPVTKNTYNVTNTPVSPSTSSLKRAQSANDSGNANIPM